MTAYAELATRSNFSFLEGASHPKHLVLSAILRGHTGLGLADRNTLAGVVRAWSALRDFREEGWAPEKKREGGGPGEFVWVEDPEFKHIDREMVKARANAFKLILGARLRFNDATPDILAYPEDRQGWGRLCRLLTLGNSRARKGQCEIGLRDLLRAPEGLLLIVMPPRRLDGLEAVLRQANEAAPGAVWLGAAMRRTGDDRRRLVRLKALGAATGTPLLAVNDVLYHDAGQRDLQDVVTCIREGVTLETAGRRLDQNAERYLKPAAEMSRLFADEREAVAETQDFLARVAFDLKQLEYNYPEEPIPPGWDPHGWLEHLVTQKLQERYREGAPPRVLQTIKDELAFIKLKKLAPYFLTIHDIVRVSKNKGILCQGRGSAANSAVCYVLGITAVDPSKHDMLFERFLSSARDEPPDIDVDFEHARREEIMQDIYTRYGRERAGIAATVIRYRPRSAIREVGKVMGLTEDVTARLAGSQWGSFGQDIPDRHLVQAGLEVGNPTVIRAVAMTRRLLEFPRHLSQHVGGFVLTQDRLDEIVPIGNAAMPDRTFIEWDKDDIDALGLMKVDVLALGMLTCIAKAFDLMREHDLGDLELDTVPDEDPTVYGMLQEGRSIGVFQVESRAQINMLPRLKPKEFYDLAIQVAIVRPGPIQGNMVHPYLRRRSGAEEPDYPKPGPTHPQNELRDILEKTLGVPLFQEQAMRIAMEAAEFSPAQASALRKSMGTFRGDGSLAKYEDQMVGTMIARGYDPDFARNCFEQIKGFGSYGFPESHAVSFAKLVYISSWIKCHHPAVFACALLNSQPMGFYAPAQLVRDAQESPQKVEVRAIDVNHSVWDNTLEETDRGREFPALRLGLRQIDGFRQGWAVKLAEARGDGFTDVEEMARRTGLEAAAMRKLADADAFRSLGLDRREGLWAVRRLPDDAPLPLFQAARARELGVEGAANLPLMPLKEHIATDYQTTRLSLKGHPMQILRPMFRAEGVLSAADVQAQKHGRLVRTAGVVLVRQRPGTGNAIFVTMEDETGVVNALLWARLFETFRREVMAARLMEVEGTVEKSVEGVLHVMVRRVFDRSAELKRLSEDYDLQVELSRADAVKYPQAPRSPTGRHPRDVRILPGSRDFH